MPVNELTIGFCTTCRNRLWQLKEALPENLEAIEGTPHTISLVDFGSSDGLDDWVWSNFEKEIRRSRLRFFQVKNQVNWHMSKAKNLAHRISHGGYLFSLDADNFLTRADVAKIENVADSGLACHQFSGYYGDGSHGRIGLSKGIFMQLGGYDESMLPMGYQDADLLKRLSALSMQVVKLGAPDEVAIQNSKADKMSNVGKTSHSDLDSYSRMNDFNREFSGLRIAHEGPIRIGGYSSYAGVLNGQRVLLDGFNNIHPANWD